MRSFLFVPGDRPDRFVKAEATGADAVILDLEDAVTPEQRPTARSAIATHLAGVRRVPLWVRINPIQTPDALADLVAVLPGRPDGIVLPKARHGDDVHRLDHWLEALESQHGIEVGSIRVMPMVTETASALLTMSSFACVPKRVTAFTWGAEDLATELGALGNRDAAGDYELPYALASALTLYAASAAGVPAIDTVDTETPASRATSAICRRSLPEVAAGLGLDGVFLTMGSSGAIAGLQPHERGYAIRILACGLSRTSPSGIRGCKA